MATSEQIEKAISKAELFGVNELTKEQKAMLVAAAKQAGSVGRRAKAVFD